MFNWLKKIVYYNPFISDPMLDDSLPLTVEPVPGQQCCATCKYGCIMDKQYEHQTYSFVNCKRFPRYQCRELIDWCGEYQSAKVAHTEML